MDNNTGEMYCIDKKADILNVIQQALDSFYKKHKVYPNIIWLRTDYTQIEAQLKSISVVFKTKDLQPHHFILWYINKRHPVTYKGNRRPVL